MTLIAKNIEKQEKPGKGANVRGEWKAWSGVWLIGAVGMVALVAGGWRALNSSGDYRDNTSAAMYTLLDTGNALDNEIVARVKPAMERTDILAKSPEMVEALLSGDRAAQTALLNSKITTATEVDAIALFDSAGRIVAINSLYADGRPIGQERLKRVLGADFSSRGIVQNCLRNTSNGRILEFQTRCDITPAFFDSTGLAVAYSVPVLNPADGTKLGVVSSRTRFERLSSLIEGQSIAGGAARAYFITDAGGYFSETINSGKERPPVPTAELKDLVRPVVGNREAKTVTTLGDKYVAIFSPKGMGVMDGGGIHVLIVADGKWLTDGPRQARLVQGAAGGLIGALLLIVAGMSRARLLAGRVREAVARANEGNARLAAIVDASNEGIISDDLNGKILSWNPGATKIFGYTAAEAIGRDSSFMEPASRRGEIARLTAEALSGKSVDQMESKRIRKDGREIDVSVSISLIRDSSGKVVAISRIVRDITAQKVTEAELTRTHEELARAHTKLVDAARQAGMAEIAIGVLHNVGNVLNSVNVSANMVDGRVRRSKVPSLGKMVTMLREHEGELGEFMERDGKGKEVVGYLDKLSQALSAEQKDVLSELETLTKNVEHVKEIVSAQQSYATAVAIVEALNIRTLIEDALRINLMALERHQIEVVKDYGETPCVMGDKHKVLQVLVNLITNAKQAMVGVAARRLTIVTRAGEGGKVSVTIRDTGCGITAENLTRIFSHGFTTKKGGHGIGLHSSVLAAKEMNGSIAAFSDGPGLGSTFVFELPGAGAGVIRKCT